MIPGRRILVTGASRSGIETKISPAHPAQLVRRAMRHERWALGLVDQSVESIARHGITGAIRWLVNDNRWVFLADPFCYVLPDGRMVILAQLPHFCSAATLKPAERLAWPVAISSCGAN